MERGEKTWAQCDRLSVVPDREVVLAGYPVDRSSPIPCRKVIRSQRDGLGEILHAAVESVASHIRNGTSVEGFMHVRIQRNRPTIVRNGEVVLALLYVGRASTVEGRRKVGVQLNGPRVV